MRGGEPVLVSVFWRLRGRPRGLPEELEDVELLVMLSGVDALELGTGDAEEQGEEDEPVVSLKEVDADAERLVSAKEGERGGLDKVTALSRV